MERLVSNLSTASVRRELTSDGRQYLVAPVTLIVPGVLNGSKGPLYYPADEIRKDPSIWNHMPLVVYHPSTNGINVSARDPDILDRQGVGLLMRVNANGKLRGEAWFDVEKTRKVDNRVLERLEAGKPIEVSTGLFTDNEPAENGANYNGKSYAYVARNYRPDHLAILPDQIGACSIKDGCGILVNKDSCPIAAMCHVLNFDPKQPRDKEGQWSSGGSFASVGGAYRPDESRTSGIDKEVAEAPKRSIAEIFAERDAAKKAERAAKKASKSASGESVAKQAGLDPPGKHNVAIPKDKKRLTIDQATSALDGMGYKSEGLPYDLKNKTAMYRVTDRKGKTVDLNSDQVKALVYSGATTNQRQVFVEEMVEILINRETNALVETLNGSSLRRVKELLSL